jgi:uncharacterized protein
MLVLQKEDNGKGMFYISIHDETLAKMTYKMESPQLMTIIHTEVDDELRGKNAGYQLVHAAVDYARENNIKIIPLCPFAKSVFEKKAEFADVLKQ